MQQFVAKAFPELLPLFDENDGSSNEAARHGDGALKCPGLGCLRYLVLFHLGGVYAVSVSRASCTSAHDLSIFYNTRHSCTSMPAFLQGSQQRRPSDDLGK
eukprot:1156389-Pelagomonas_calceolata.AAC.4